MSINIEEFKKSGNYEKHQLTPLTSIHLYSNKEAELGPNSSIQYVYIFSAIAIFILLIACVNFMNLSTARSANRAKEVGVRKVLGSLRKNLVGQFLTESMLISFISFVLAIGLAFLMLQFFNGLAQKQLSSTLTGFLPVDGWRNNDALFTSTDLDIKKAISSQQWGVDEDYIPTLQMQLKEGRNFSKQYPSDSGAVIINEAAAKFFAGQDPL